MDPAELRALTKRLRRHPVHEGRATAATVRHGTDALMRILPHRAPFLLVDRVDSVDLAERTILGHRRLDPADPVFAGHFPGSPVYPGVLQVEMTGQVALCLTHFLTRQTLDVPADATPTAVRALAVHAAQYLEPVVPGDEVEIHAVIVAEDGMTATAAGQVVKHGRVASFAVQEVYFVE
jgi:3-hydroxyacyl-[acyl-carrier-protein] dehydratase